MAQLKHLEDPVGVRGMRERRRRDLRKELEPLRLRRDELLAWVMDNTSSPIWEEQLREYNLAAQRCDTLFQRLTNLRHGLPELGQPEGLSLRTPHATKLPQLL